MKSRIMSLGTMAASLSVAAWVLNAHIEVGVTQEAWAVTDTSAISAACTDPTVTALTPGAAYTLTWAAPSRTAAATPSATVSLGANVIHAETDPNVTSTLNCAGCGAGEVLMVNQTPGMKLAGLQCQALSAAKRDVSPDGTNNLSFDIAIGSIADSDNIWTSTDQVDSGLATAVVVLNGTGGIITGTNLADGSDSSAATDGEVIFSGATEASGASQTSVKVDVTNYNVLAATDAETLTFTFTGS